MGNDAQREQKIFLQAQDYSTPEEMDAYLDQACEGDATLRKRVDELLKIHLKAGDFLAGESSLSQPQVPRNELDSGASANPALECIGRYKLLQKIGEGGFGEVFMAEQREPVRRKVALKIIKLGMDTKQVVGRFEAERQALALMEHPNIARVLDGGSTERGRPYFVMELVRGIPITQFCNEDKLSTEERLRLMIQVCHAIQHAHQKGIIHRDIKPSNVLVTRHDHQAVPKVIDFGIAKALQQDLTDKTIFTRFHELIGTPAYMSPEQAQMSGLDIDTRSDIYALGVMLYELLTGHPPFNSQELLKAGYDEMRRRIREVEPPKPSTRLSTLSLEDQTSVAQLRNTSKERLRHLLHGDLDWIVMKAMEKDRSRRYDSASDLAKDIQRYLENHPVMAAAPSAVYRFQKLIRRHRTGAATTAILLLLLIAGIIVSSYFAIRATRAERRARQEAALADAVNRFLNEDLFAQLDPNIEPDRELKVRTLLDRAAQQIESRFNQRPQVEATLHATVGQIYYKLGEFESAEKHLLRSQTLRAKVLGETHPDTIAASSDLAMNWLLMSRRAEACELGEKVVPLARQLMGIRHPKTFRYLSRLAWIYFIKGDTEKAYQTAREALDQVPWIPSVDAEDHALALQVMGRMLGRQGKRDLGEKMQRDALALLSRKFGDADLRSAIAKNRVAAYLYDHAYKRDEAEKLYLEALDQHRRIFGESHPRVRSIRGNLVLLYLHREPVQPLQAAFHQLKILLHTPTPRSEEELKRLRDLITWTPLSSLDELPAGQMPQWEFRTHPPLSHWMKEDFNTEDWKRSVTPSGSELWLRRNFTIRKIPAEGFFMVLPTIGQYSVYINGKRISPRFFRRCDLLHVMIGDSSLADLLRLGKNLLAIHCVDSPPQQSVKVDLFGIPGQVTEVN